MVNAELLHNPYLLETEAMFNGREPKVNSAIEKFEGRPLVEWVNEVPRTYRDEMNGLDFDLYFTGTDSDYKRIMKAFLNQGITVFDSSASSAQSASYRIIKSSDVRLIHKGSFEDVDIKRSEIEEFIAWLDTHRNRWFDYDEFMSNNSEALDGLVPYIIVSDNAMKVELPHVSVEIVDSTQEDLAGLQLTSTPILFMVNYKNKTHFRKELLYVLKRADIDQEQLFFYIHPSMNRERVIRVISDLGVENPQVVEKPDDVMILQYLKDRPSTEYVRKSLAIFRKVYDEISTILENVSVESAESNKDRLKEISRLDSEIGGLKKTRALISASKPIDNQTEVASICQQFEDSILSWRNRKTGVTGQTQIWNAARDFEYDLRGWIRIFETDLYTTMQSGLSRTDRALSSLYYAADAATGFDPAVERPVILNTVTNPNLITALTNQTGTQKVSTKSDFFGFFGGSSSSNDETESVEIASYDVWRFTVRGMLMPKIQEVVETSKQQLADYHESLVEAYRKQLDILIDDLVEDKEMATAMLSDVEQMLEEDKNWLSEYKERMHAIGRN